MRTAHHSPLRFTPSLSFVLLLFFLAVLWLAGGASRADALGQVLVRAAAWGVLIVVIVFGDRAAFRRAVTEARPIFLLLAAAVVLGLAQLVPLPPGAWTALPGRAMLAEAAAASGQPQPWRPWSIVPSATINAVSSLIVPAATLALVTGLRGEERARLPGILLAMVAAATFVGLLQFSGLGFNNPFINETVGEVAGTFANRNHLALFLAIGCLLAPVWAFVDGREPRWRGPVALGLVVLFLLTILAGGSRAGLILAALAIVLGLVLVRQGIRRALRRYPRWIFPALLAGIVGLIAIFVLLSIVAGRAVSIDRAFALDEGQDMRQLGLPTVMAMIRAYFPFGSGLGGFDPIFRIHEPFALLKLTYFNHAHNDLLELVLDAGLAGLLLLLVGVAWWLWASAGAWRTDYGVRHAVPKLGSSILLLVIFASGFDYPARTPMIMAVLVIAGVWLAGRREERQRVCFTGEGAAPIARQRSPSAGNP